MTSLARQPVSHVLPENSDKHKAAGSFTIGPLQYSIYSVGFFITPCIVFVSFNNMGKHCSYGLCKSDSRYAHKDHMKGVFFIPFVKPRKQREKCLRWITACYRQDFGIENITKDTYICIVHFVGGNGPTPEHPDPIPAAYGHEQVERFTRKRRKPPTERTLLPAKKVHEEVDESPQLDPPAEEVQIGSIIPSVGTQTNPLPTTPPPSMQDGVTQTEVSEEISNLRLENMLLRNKLKLMELKEEPNKPTPTENDNQGKTFSYKHIEKNNKLFTFYTGLTFLKFMAIFNFLGPAAHKLTYWNRDNQDPETSPAKKSGPKRKLEAIEEFFLVLVRLRLGLLQQDLGFSFGISSSQVSTIVITWIQFLYFQFSSLKTRVFPPIKVVKKLTPFSCKKFKNMRCIIDCTEIFTEQPSDFAKQGNMYSSFKGTTTVKILVAILPNGLIAFVSDAFEGSISDRDIVQKSGFLDEMHEGDLVLADRGFTIKDLLLKKRARLNIPPFLGTREKFTAWEEIQTKKIAKVHIHVERAIERMNKYRILKHRLPATLTPQVSQMVFVVSMLVNHQRDFVE